MSQSYSITLSDQAKRCMANLRNSTAVMAAVCAAIDKENELTTGYIQRNFLSGPGKRDLTTLAVVTNRLRSSARPVKATVSGGIVFSGIGSNVKYAAPHEFGFTGTVNVPAHQRRNSILDRFDHAGVEVDRFTALRAGILSKKQASQNAQDSGKYVFAKKKAKQTVTGGQITVRAHTMQMNLPARRMFQRGIEARLDATGKAISAAIVKTWSAN